MNAMKRIFACFIAFFLSWIPWALSPGTALAQTLPVSTLELSQPLLAQSLQTLTREDLNPVSDRNSFEIAFDEYPANTPSPVYSPDTYDANTSAPTVTFRAFFKGQDYALNPDEDCNGASEFGCIVKSPSSPLTLDNSAYVRSVNIGVDNQASKGRVLTTQNNSAYSILFDKDVASVGVSVLALDVEGSVRVRVFDRQGNLLQETTNQNTGKEFFGFGSNNDTDKIAGMQLSLANPEPEGFKIENLSFKQVAYQADVIAAKAIDPNQNLQGVLLVEEDSFSSPTGQITFNERSSNLWTARYEPSAYGGGTEAPTVTFRAFFEGQNYSEDSDRDCGGSMGLGCIVGNPSAPLALASTNAYVRSAQARAESSASNGMVLDTQNHAAYSAYFDRDVARIGVRILGFNEEGRTAIKVYDRQGRLLGRVSNHRRGDEFFGFATEDNEDRIAGLQVSMLESEFNGYLLGDIAFVQKVDIPSVNQPPTPANSIRDFSGVQGEGNWYYGYYQAPVSANNLDTLAFKELTFNENQKKWFFEKNIYETQIGRRNVKPNSDVDRQGRPKKPSASGQPIEKQWVVRRWQSDGDGPIRICGQVSVDKANRGDGTQNYIFVNGGSPKLSQDISDDTTVPLVLDLTVARGDKIDFITAPKTSDRGDLTTFTVEISDPASAKCS
ncbi:MAG: hypothetical protein J7647_18360 [Cyanobacteria bacterium SBLK]|nr:hypothetical protein [Cyanobacteria bacterium SBLK]